MAAIKSYTDLKQSKKLVEILPIKSADMCWYLATKGNPKAVLNEGYNEYGDFELPCWSLAALLGVLPKNLKIGRPSLVSNYKGYYWIQYYDEFMESNNHETKCFDNPVDACVAMIEKLHELKML